MVAQGCCQGKLRALQSLEILRVRLFILATAELIEALLNLTVAEIIFAKIAECQT